MNKLRILLCAVFVWTTGMAAMAEAPAAPDERAQFKKQVNALKSDVSRLSRLTKNAKSGRWLQMFHLVNQGLKAFGAPVKEGTLTPAQREQRTKNLLSTYSQLRKLLVEDGAQNPTDFANHVWNAYDRGTPVKGPNHTEAKDPKDLKELPKVRTYLQEQLLPVMNIAVAQLYSAAGYTKVEKRTFKRGDARRSVGDKVREHVYNKGLRNTKGYKDSRDKTKPTLSDAALFAPLATNLKSAGDATHLKNTNDSLAQISKALDEVNAANLVCPVGPELDTRIMDTGNIINAQGKLSRESALIVNGATKARADLKKSLDMKHAEAHKQMSEEVTKAVKQVRDLVTKKINITWRVDGDKFKFKWNGQDKTVTIEELRGLISDSIVAGALSAKPIATDANFKHKDYSAFVAASGNKDLSAPSQLFSEYHKLKAAVESITFKFFGFEGATPLVETAIILDGAKLPELKKLDELRSKYLGFTAAWDTANRTPKVKALEAKVAKAKMNYEKAQARLVVERKTYATLKACRADRAKLNQRIGEVRTRRLQPDTHTQLNQIRDGLKSVHKRAN